MVLACVVLPPPSPLLYVTLHFGDLDPLQIRNRAELIFLMCEQKPLQKLSVIVWTWPKTLYLVHEPLEPG